MTDSSLRFDPFALSVIFRLLRRLRSSSIMLLAPVLVALAVLASLFEGTFAFVGQAPYATDLRHLVELHSAGATEPAFPLQRDLVTIALMVLIALTGHCVHLQWRVMTDCLVDLDRGGVLRWREDHQRPGLTRLLGVSAATAADMTSRDLMAHWLMCRARDVKRRQPVLILASVVLALGLILYERFGRVFIIYAPDGQSRTAQQIWADQAYDSWWASMSLEHAAGATVYFLLVVLGVFVVLAQNAVALVAARVARVLPALAQLDIDWLNSDGGYGWRPVERLFKTVYWSMSLRAVTLTILLIAFGLQNTLVIGVISGFWLVFLVLYVVLPYRMLSQTLNEARSRRIEALREQSTRLGVTQASRPAEIQEFVDEFQRTRRARINPLSLPRWQISSFFVTVLLPVILTVVQIVIT